MNDLTPNRLPQCLARLGLDGSADERAVRRAYAQQLKNIDQEADPAAFQALHETFEAAKEWLRTQARQAPAAQPPAGELKQILYADLELLAPPVSALDQADSQQAPELPPTPGRPVFQPADPVTPPVRQPANRPGSDYVEANQDRVGAAVFADFADEFARQAARGDLCNEASVKRALERSLHDARLINLLARTGFEARVAQLLANGWLPGHHVLFEVASQIFQWMDDSRRLDALGEVGPFLNKALVEYAIFLKTPPAALKNRRRLIERLRDPVPPEAQEVATNLKTIETMFARYPTWLRLVTNVSNIGIWRAREAEHAKEVVVNQGHSKADEAKFNRTKAIVSLGILALIVFISHESSKPRPYQTFPAYVQSDQTPPKPTAPSMVSLSPPLNLVSPPATQQAPTTTRVHYSEAQFKEATDKIKSNLVFHAPNLPVRDDQVKYSIEVGADGRVIRLDKTASSALPDFDDAVRKAIYHAQPFPALDKEGTSAVFTIWAKPTK